MKLIGANGNHIRGVIGKGEFKVFTEVSGEAENLCLVSIQNVLDIDDLKPFVHKYKEALCLRFDDVLDGMENSINDDQALRIARFLEKHCDDRILFHCEAGVSRSAGVALAFEVLVKSGGHKERFSYHNSNIASNVRYMPNMDVFDRVCKFLKKRNTCLKCGGSNFVRS